MQKVDIHKIPVCYQSLNERGEIVVVNDKWEKLTGYKLSEVKGKAFQDLLTPLSKEKFNKKFPAFLKNGKLTGITFTLILKGNKKINISINGIIEKKEEKLFTHCVFTDISEKVILENKLAKQQAFMEKILSSVDEIIYIFNIKNHKFIYQNKTGFLGYKQNEVLSPGSLTDYVHPEDKNKTIEYWKMLISQPESNLGSVIYRIQDKNGYYQWVKNKAFEYERDSNNRIQSLIITVSVITSIMEMKHDLNVSDQKYLNLVDSALDGILIMDLKGRITDFNNSLLQMSGYTSKELLNKHFTKIPGIKIKDIPRYIKIFKSLHLEKFPESLTVSWKKKDGNTVDSDLRISKIKDGEKTTGFIIIARDITEHNQMIRQLKKSREELRGLARHLEYVREEERSIMARELHDELGQTLTAVKFDLMFLQKELKRPLKNVNLNDTLRLLEDTIDLTRQLGAKLRPGIIDDLGLGPAIEWLIENFQKRTLVDLDMEITADARELDMDVSIAVFRIIQEAITNIMRHSCATATEVRFREIKKGKYEFYIKDNGIGFDPDKVDRSKCYGLMGMTERARVIGSQVVVESARGKGTKISVFI